MMLFCRVHSSFHNRAGQFSIAVRNLLFIYGEEYTEEPLWKGEMGEIAFLSPYRYDLAFAQISA
jgi:hypothetical protein